VLISAKIKPRTSFSFSGKFSFSNIKKEGKALKMHLVNEKVELSAFNFEMNLFS